MAEYSRHQQKIIERYYDQRETIMLTKLQELVTELYLAETPKKRAALWKRAVTAMSNLKVSPRLCAHLVERDDPEILAKHLKDWMKKGPPK